MNPEPTEPVATATQRLVQSRALLRQAMQPKPSPSDSPKSPPAWLDALRDIPLVAVLVEAVSSWWMQHPLRAASLLVADTARSVVQPLARRSPMALALGALVLGGLVAWSRPWRWIAKPAMFAGLLPQLLSKSIAHVPLEAWLTALGGLAWKTNPTPAGPTPPPVRGGAGS